MASGVVEALYQKIDLVSEANCERFAAALGSAQRLSCSSVAAVLPRLAEVFAAAPNAATARVLVGDQRFHAVFGSGWRGCRMDMTRSGWLLVFVPDEVEIGELEEVNLPSRAEAAAVTALAKQRPMTKRQLRRLVLLE
jgi:hypothetical protein